MRDATSKNSSKALFFDNLTLEELVVYPRDSCAQEGRICPILCQLLIAKRRYYPVYVPNIAHGRR